MMISRRLAPTARAASAAFTLLLAGCPDTPPPTPTDTPRRDVGTPPLDAAPFDAFGMDVPPPLDADVLDTPGADVPGLDAPGADVPGLDAPGTDAPRDAGPPEDITLMVRDAGACGSGDMCACTFTAPPCASGACSASEELTCLDDGCRETCVPRGAPCETPADCPAGGLCKFNGTTRNCSPAATGCLDSRECPLGFACIAGACSDRRVGCDPDNLCPHNFYCETSGPAFCLRLSRPCVNDGGCPTGICRDVDGDGDRECIAPGTCTTNAMCSGDDGCMTVPGEVFASCGRYGACVSAAADCASGQLCLDLWGDGVRECVDPGGTCATTADCPTGICGSPGAGGPPTCLTRSLPL
jgi:hypothetical protein